MGSDDEVEIYETLSEDLSIVEETPEINLNPEIYSGVVSRDDALQSIVGRANEPLSERVARIRREIEEIREEAPPDLISELRSALQRPAPAVKSEAGPIHETAALEGAPGAIEASNEFAALESRVAQLELRLGASFRAQTLRIPIADTISTIQTTLNLLSSDPELVEQRIQRLRQLTPSSPRDKHHTSSTVAVAPAKDDTASKVDWIYTQLRSLEDQIAVIPSVVSRLQTLRFFHAETLDSNEQIKRIGAEIDQMRREIKEWNEVLTKLSNKIS